jgi:hypothetical protein
MDIFNNPLFVSGLMLVWGMLVRYSPKFQAWPNRLIVWMNIAIGILAKIAAPDVAHAGGLGGLFHGIGDALGPMLVPVEALLARTVFEGIVKPTLEHFGILGYPAGPVKDIRQGRAVR